MTTPLAGVAMVKISVPTTTSSRWRVGVSCLSLPSSSLVLLPFVLTIRTFWGAAAAVVTAGIARCGRKRGDRVRRLSSRIGASGWWDAPCRRVRCDQRRGESDARPRARGGKRWGQRRGRKRPFRGCSRRSVMDKAVPLVSFAKSAPRFRDSRSCCFAARTVSLALGGINCGVNLPRAPVDGTRSASSSIFSARPLP